jgi:hypothetical protein
MASVARTATIASATTISIMEKPSRYLGIFSA